MWQQCNDLYRKFQVFILPKIIKGEVRMIEMFCFLQMTAEIQANPWIFFWQCRDKNLYPLKIIENARTK